jgi:hypothetical protein
MNIQVMQELKLRPMILASPGFDGPKKDSAVLLIYIRPEKKIMYDFPVPDTGMTECYDFEEIDCPGPSLPFDDWVLSACDSSNQSIQVTLCTSNIIQFSSSEADFSGVNFISSKMISFVGTVEQFKNLWKHWAFNIDFYSFYSLNVITKDKRIVLLINFSTDTKMKCYNYYKKDKPCPQLGDDFYGQDANYQINMPSYTKLDDKGNQLENSAKNWSMVKDNATGLIWECKTDDGSIHDKYNKYKWYDGNPDTNAGNTGSSSEKNTEEFITALNIQNFGGYSDWRVPSYKELSSITNWSLSTSFIDTFYFPNNINKFYWSSTSCADFTGRVLGIKYYDGLAAAAYKTNPPWYVRAVRGGNHRLFNHLIINGDGTVTDIGTGLMWQKSRFDSQMNWQAGLKKCAELSLAGYDDWRLPTKKELLSIVNYELFTVPVVYKDIFPDMQSDIYWSSTPNASNSSIWAISFSYGEPEENVIFISNYVRAVRGGQNHLKTSLIIESPSQGSSWSVQDNIPIIWDTKDIPGNVNIYISRQGGRENTYEIIAENTENDGSYTWNASGPSASCMLKIEPVNAPDRKTEQGLFCIHQPCFFINVPDLFFEDNEKHEFTFTIIGPENDRPELSITSSNIDLIPDENIVADADGLNVTLTFLSLDTKKHGNTTITIEMTGETCSSSDTFTMTILPVNDPPLIHLSTSSFYTTENTCFFVSDFDPSWIDITDEDAANETVQLTLCAINGFLRLTQTENLSLISGDFESTMMSFTGSLKIINNALKHLIFIPFTDYHGHAGIKIDVNDLGHIGNDTPKTSQAVLHIFVNPQQKCISAFPIPDTDQIDCYDNNEEMTCPQPGEDFYGQDAHYIINPTSYVKLDAKGNELPDSSEHWSMVLDKVTGLIWEVKTDDESIHDRDNQYTWYDSNPKTNADEPGTPSDGTDTEDFITNLNSNLFGGYSDWRLPSIRELASIISFSEQNQIFEGYFYCIHTNILRFFYGNGTYWSSTKYMNGTNTAWGINFSSRIGSTLAKSSYYYARAVRGGQCQPLDHLLINKDNTITDIHTGLMWQRNTFDSQLDWHQALIHCENLSFAGYNDWRLPTIKELRSIVDFNNINPAINGSIFSDTRSEKYWTSTSSHQYNDNAWSLNFSYGVYNDYSKSSLYYVRAVRGGQQLSNDSVIIQSPKQGSIWKMHDTIPITWDSNEISGNVNILISRQGGQEGTFVLIAENIENDGSYSWEATGDGSVNCVLKIESVSEPEKMNVIGLFSIKEDCFFTRIPDYSFEDADQHWIDFTLIGPENEIPELTVTSSNINLIPNENIQIESEGSYRIMTLQQKDATLFGSTTLSLEMISQSCTSSDSFNVTIIQVNDPPLIHLSESAFYTKENKPLKLSDFDESWITISDEDASDHPIQITLCAINGLLQLTQTTLLSLHSERFVNIEKMSFSGSIDTINRALKSLIFIPESYYFGHAGIKIIADDHGFTGPDGAKTNQDDIHIYINPEQSCLMVFPVSDSGLTRCFDDTTEITCPLFDEDFYGQDTTYSINTRSFIKLDALGNDLPDSADQWAMVRDNITGLIWEVKTDDDSVHGKHNKYSWYDSNPGTNGGNEGVPGKDTDTEDFIQKLNVEQLGGYSDWRLPSTRELASIVNLGRKDSFIDIDYFPNNQSSYYWTSTSNVLDNTEAWRIDFDDGEEYLKKKENSYYVRAVRGGQYCLFGHFIINDDDTATDVCTGLMWKRKAFDSVMNWQTALSYCENLSFAGYNDWRLPTREELRSIAHYTNKKQALDQNIFFNEKASSYWSSTPNVISAYRGWGIDFNDQGTAKIYNKDSAYYVRAVRGGQYRSLDNLVIITPKQGIIYKTTDIIPIIWTTKDIPGDVNILISYEGGKAGTFTEIIHSTENDGYYDWEDSKTASANCMLRIESVDAPSKATMNGLFALSSLSISILDNVSTKEDTSVTIHFSISDSLSNTLSVKAISSNDTLLPDENLHFSQNNTSQVILSASSMMNYTLAIMPVMGQWGTSIISIIAINSDGDNEVKNFQLSVNDPPVLNKFSSLSVIEDGSALLTKEFLWVTDKQKEPKDIIFKLDFQPKYGSITRNGKPLTENISFSQEDINNGLIAYVHHGDESETRDIFKFVVSDDNLELSETFVININLIDDPPVIKNTIPNIETHEDASEISIDLIDTFIDADNPSKYIDISLINNSNPSLVTVTLSDTKLTLYLKSDKHGLACITLQALSHGLAVTTAFDVFVASQDDLPIVSHPIQDISVEEDAPTQIVDLDSVFFDADGDPIKCMIQENSNPNIVSSSLSENILSFEFLPNQHGTAFITILATSNGKQISTSLNINVDSIDDPMIIQPVEDILVDEDAPITTIDLSHMFFDVDNEIIVDIQSNSNPTLLTASLKENLLQLLFKENQYGNACITLLAKSIYEQNTANIIVSVISIDDPLVVANPIEDIIVKEDSPNKDIDLRDVFVDADHPLTISIQENANPDILDITLTSNSIELHFIENQNGEAQITLCAHANEKSLTDSFRVTVTSVNGHPSYDPKSS